MEAASLNGRVATTSSVLLSGFLSLQEWTPFLQLHPDEDFAQFMRWGLSSRFRIGFNPDHPLRAAPGNFSSVQNNPAIVDRYIANEVASGRLVESQDPNIRRNPIGIIPKPHQPGKFQLIVDLSAPRGSVSMAASLPSYAR